MSEQYKVAIIGAGPAGISAATHAAQTGTSHILLEKTDHLADTIYQYQKGKHVMAEPGNLPLRANTHFEAGTREQVLSVWDNSIDELKVNVAYHSEVIGIEGEKGHFIIKVKNNDDIAAEYIIFSIGLQGNIRTLGVEGEDLPFVQYTLADPDEYHNEHIVVVGAGDAAIENAVALSKNNKVSIINRKGDFARAKEGNFNLINKSIDSGEIECYYNSNTRVVEPLNSGSEKPGQIVLDTDAGEAIIPCDRIIARLGAIPPRQFVSACGIEFPNDSPTAIPVVDGQYQSNVPGLFIIGALGGYPLIKQAMNQGYEAVEFALGNKVEMADHPILEERFQTLPFKLSVDDTLNLIQERIAIFNQVNALLFRELMLGSQVHTMQSGELIFKKNDYTNSFYTILNGSVKVWLDPEGKETITLNQGEFFGEMSLISGRRRSATVEACKDCIVIETPQRTMNKLINSDDLVKRVLDETFIIRTIQSVFTPHADISELQSVASRATLENFRPGDVIFNEGEEADSLHIIRRGSATVSRQIGGKEVVLSYVASGNYVGEMGVLGNTQRIASVKAAVNTETVRLDSAAFLELLDKEPELKEKVQQKIKARLVQTAHMGTQEDSGSIISFLMKQGLGEATDVLLIDENLCVGCDNCEKACAETHQGTSRLNRRAGPSYAHIHVPTSCRHCEHPHCMKDCPPDAIHRAANGEVFMDDSCIGCGNCERNCPYGVIQMAYEAPKKPKLWQWLLFGSGSGPGQDKSAKPTSPDAQKKAVKCDMCKDQTGGPACVRACPTGAAIRISPEEFVDLAEKRGLGI